jgi:hypothetical protein
MAGSTSDAMKSYLETAASALEALAEVVLGQHISSVAKPGEHAWCVRDRDVLQQDFGSEEPASWIATTASLYLGEAAHQLQAVAVLLRAEALTGSLGPLVRAVIERVGVISWMLDVETTDSLERAWRAMLNSLVCSSEYRKAIEQLGADKSQRRELAREHRERRARVATWFSPEVDQDAPNDSALWARSGSRYPDLTTIAAMAMPGDLGQKVRTGVYAAQCGMTHPNIFVLGETVMPAPDGAPQFVHRAGDVDKEVRASFVSFARGIMTWSRYFSLETEFDALQSRISEISDRFEAGSAALGSAAGASDTSD